MKLTLFSLVSYESSLYINGRWNHRELGMKTEKTFCYRYRSKINGCFYFLETSFSIHLELFIHQSCMAHTLDNFSSICNRHNMGLNPDYRREFALIFVYQKNSQIRYFPSPNSSARQILLHLWICCCRGECGELHGLLQTSGRPVSQLFVVGFGRRTYVEFVFLLIKDADTVCWTIIKTYDL